MKKVEVRVESDEEGETGGEVRERRKEIKLERYSIVNIETEE